ncbi:hypothetical protein SESBI_37506 [Sesbania bispinosa]|nr:hypothetical protein SESBI_37506 [Sesbania bispinosa]
MLNFMYRKKKMEEIGLTEEEYYQKQFEIKGEIPEPLVTKWAGPLVVRLCRRECGRWTKRNFRTSGKRIKWQGVG